MKKGRSQAYAAYLGLTAPFLESAINEVLFPESKIKVSYKAKSSFITRSSKRSKRRQRRKKEESLNETI